MYNCVCDCTFVFVCVSLTQKELRKEFCALIFTKLGSYVKVVIVCRDYIFGVLRLLEECLPRRENFRLRLSVVTAQCLRL